MNAIARSAGGDHAPWAHLGASGFTRQRSRGCAVPQVMLPSVREHYPVEAAL
jgi:hypothetical protein